MKVAMSHSFLTLAVLVSVLAGAPQTSSAADAVPKFDIEKNCRAELSAGSFGETLASCTADEQRARDELTPQWNRFARADKATCIRETEIDGSPSYVELLTCLEMTPSGRTKPGAE